MKNFTLTWTILLLFTFSLFSQESILVVQKPFIVMMDAETGDIIDSEFIDLNQVVNTTPKAVRQIGNEIWVSDQIEDAIFRFDMEGNYLSTVSGNMDNIKGFELINDSEVWVTNAGTANGAPGNAIVRLDLEGNYLGFFSTDDRSSFDVVDNKNGHAYISIIHQGSPIEKRDYSGNFVENIVNPGILNFPQQIGITADGNLLVGNFSSPSGVYIFDIETGAQLNYWSQSGVRGVAETNDGSILWTGSSGINRLDPATGINTLLAAGNAQYFTRVNMNGAGCTTPSLAVAAPDPVCEGETATITATSNGDEVNWYDDAAATTPIHTGLSFTTPALTETTSYWVQAVSFGGQGELIEGGARVAPTNISGSSVNPGTAPWGLSFDADVDFTINSVDVYLTGAAGNLEMQLLDENWAVLQTTTVACPAGNSSSPVQFEVPLNFEAEAGNTYRLVAAASPEMIREFSSGHPGFPYPLGDAGSVTGGTINNSNTNSAVYYFFYNWTLTTGGLEVCESDLEEVSVTVNPVPESPEGESEQFFDLGDTLADLDVEATGELTWYEDENGTTEIPETTELEDGVTYYVSQTIDNCESDLLAITVHLRLGVSNYENNPIRVYPNPVTDILFITSEKPVDLIEIFDITGRKLTAVKTITNGSFDFSDYAAGIYMMKIKAGKEIRSLRVIKR